MEGLPALLMGLEKLKAGRGSPVVEYSEVKDGERATFVFVNGENGECDLERLELGDKLLTCNESYDSPRDISSTSEPSPGTDLTLGECRDDRKEPGDLARNKLGRLGSFTERESMEGIFGLFSEPVFERFMLGCTGVASCTPIRRSTGSGE